MLNKGILATADAVNRLATRALRRRGARSVRIATSVGRVHVLDVKGEGSGPTWVLVHGFGAQALNWWHVLVHLRRDYGRIVAIDLPGHGSSDLPPGGLTEQSMYQGVEEALSTLLDPGEPIIIMGNSMGGFAAVRLAQKEARRTLGVALISPFGNALAEAEAQALTELFTLATWRQTLHFVDSLFARRTPLRPVLALLLRAHMMQPHYQELVPKCRNFAALTADDLASLPKTLLIWGKQDRILPTSCRDFFVRNLPPRSTILEPEDYGHSPFLEMGPDVAERVVAWARSELPHTPDAGVARRVAA